MSIKGLYVLGCILAGVIFSLAYRLYVVLRSSEKSKNPRRGSRDTCSISIFLGSGKCFIISRDHLREEYHRRTHNRSLSATIGGRFCTLSSPNIHNQWRWFSQCGEGTCVRIYQAVSCYYRACNRKGKISYTYKIYSNNLFIQNSNSEDYHIITIPRARKVHQSIYSTPFSAFYSFLVACYHITFLSLRSGKPFSEVLLLNGPGTCLVLCIAVYVNRVGTNFDPFKDWLPDPLTFDPPALGNHITSVNICRILCKSSQSITFGETLTSAGGPVSPPSPHAQPFLNELLLLVNLGL